MSKYIGIDIGGTAIKFGLINESGCVLFRDQIPTRSEKGAIPDKVLSIVEQLQKKVGDPAGIGISTAGIVDNARGIIIGGNENLPQYTGTDWHDLLKHFALPIAVENDVNAAALAELWLGAGKNLNNFICMTIGTGIGSALIINRKLHTGSHFSAGEIGYLHTGISNIYEQNASTQALVRRARQTLDPQATGEMIFSHARNGNDAYRKLLEDWVDDLSKGIENAIYLLDPDAVLLGGGISAQGNYLLQLLESAMYRHMPQVFHSHIRLEIMHCGNDAGMIGAVYPLVH